MRQPFAVDAVITGDPHPVRALWNEPPGNFMSQTNTTRAWEALCSLDFYVDSPQPVVHTLQKRHCRHRLLPVAHWTSSTRRAPAKVPPAPALDGWRVQPPAEAKYDPEIVMDLARRMNWWRTRAGQRVA